MVVSKYSSLDINTILTLLICVTKEEHMFTILMSTAWSSSVAVSVTYCFSGFSSSFSVWKLSTVDDGHINQWLVAASLFTLLNLIDDVESVNNMTEDNVFSVKGSKTDMHGCQGIFKYTPCIMKSISNGNICNLCECVLKQQI